MLENPSTAFGDDLDEKPVQAEVPSDLGVEGRGQHVTLTHRDDPTGGGAGLHPRQHLGTRPDLLDPRRTDEHRVHRALRAVGDTPHDEVGLERVHLAPAGVAAAWPSRSAATPSGARWPRSRPT